MAGTFGILEAARSGLNASQLGMEVTTHNTANAGTPGYTREAIDQSSKSPDTGAYFLLSNDSKVGQGVSINGVYQIRDEFLDVRYRVENSNYNLYNSMNSQLSPIEDRFNPIGNSTSSTNKLVGIPGALDDLNSALNEYQTSPLSQTISSDIETKAYQLATTINGDYQSLKDTLASERSDLDIYVKGGTGDTSNGNISGGVNGMLTTIQNLNKEIASYELTGQTANDLRDTRNYYLDQLSNYMDISTTNVIDTTTKKANGMVEVTLNGTNQALIDSSNNAAQLDVTDKAKLLDGTTDNTTLSTGDYRTVIQVSGIVKSDGTKTTTSTGGITVYSTANINGGTIRAYLNVINGDGATGSDDTSNLGIPYYQTKLNELAYNFMNVMNNAGKGVKDATGATVATNNYQFITFKMTGPKNDGTDDYYYYNSPSNTAAGGSDLSLSTAIQNNIAATIKVTDGTSFTDKDGNPIKDANGNQITANWKGDGSKFLTNFDSTSKNDYYKAYTNALSASCGIVSVNDYSSNPAGVATTYNGSLIGFGDSFVGDLSSNINDISGKAQAAQTNKSNLDDQRQEISGVSSNDEGVNVLKYQQAYNANARMITAIDEMLDKLINNTGLVGNA